MVKKGLLLLVVLALAGTAAWYFFQTKPKPDNEVAPIENAVVLPKTHKDSVIQQSLDRYYALTEAFVNWDSAAIPNDVRSLQKSLTTLENDTTVRFNGSEKKLSAEAETLLQPKDITAKRKAFDVFSRNFYAWLQENKYRSSAVYLQECPMAFNDTEAGRWLSKTEAVRNPYLGLHHPEYKGGMLNCGEVKDSLSYK